MLTNEQIELVKKQTARDSHDLALELNRMSISDLQTVLYEISEHKESVLAKKEKCVLEADINNCESLLQNCNATLNAVSEHYTRRLQALGELAVSKQIGGELQLMLEPNADTSQMEVRFKQFQLKSFYLPQETTNEQSEEK